MRHPLPRHINFTCSFIATVLAREKVRPSVRWSAWGTCELRDFSKTAEELDGRAKNARERERRGGSQCQIAQSERRISTARGWMERQSARPTGVAESMTPNNLDARDDEVLPETEKAFLLIELHSATVMEQLGGGREI